MTKMKLLAGVLLVLAVLFAQVGSAAAAPQTQDGTTVTISGTVTEIGQPETDENGVTTVLVTIETAEGPQTVRVSDIVAADLEVGEEVVDLVVNSEDVIPPEEPDVHLISSLLAEFFFDGNPDMAILIDSFHTGDNEAEQVFGFGVIAQALWLSRDSDTGVTDADLAEDILIAKKTKEFDQFFLDHPDYLPEGVAQPTNWGQFKKAVKEKGEKHNLGVIVSEHADDEDSLTTQDQDKGKGNKKNDKGGPKGNNKGGKKP